MEPKLVYTKKWYDLTPYNCDRKRTRSRKYYRWVKARNEAKIVKELQRRVIVRFD